MRRCGSSSRARFRHYAAPPSAPRRSAQTNETLLAIQACPVFGPPVVIGGIADKVGDGELGDEKSLQFAILAVARLTSLCRDCRRREAA
jgi:chromate reductase, NAD(P)H dehydrogenase (quinone)